MHNSSINNNGDGIFIFGAGGLAQEMISYIKHYLPKMAIAGLIERDDEFIGQKVHGIPIVASNGWWEGLKISAKGIIAIGDPFIRKRVVETNSTIEWLSMIFADNLIMDSNEIYEGVVICPGVRFTSGIKIREHVYINLACTIGHNVEIGKYSVLNPQCSISGEVKIGEQVLIGTNATILEGRRIGDGSIVGAGAVVTKDVEPYTVVVGNPSRLLKMIGE